MGSDLVGVGDQERERGRSRDGKAGRKGFSLVAIVGKRDRERERSDQGDGTQPNRLKYAIELARAMIKLARGGSESDVSGTELAISGMEPARLLSE
ncbi:hypothetical protein COCNU_scaffold001133G000020 [Cocos nucifera]|nr:hypothetical protein [Cocos nucifera]